MLGNTKVTGMVCSGSGATRCFFGVPYAAPPVGELRFKPPQPYNWATDSFDATEHGEQCMQNSGGSEDCLFMDIYAPPVGVEPKAIMVWIHGGCFVAGNSRMYDSKDLVATGDVIVIVPHYRLGVFGYLAAD